MNGPSTERKPNQPCGGGEAQSKSLMLPFGFSEVLELLSGVCGAEARPSGLESLRPRPLLALINTQAFLKATMLGSSSITMPL